MGRPKMWRCIYFAVAWAILFFLGIVSLCIDGEGSLTPAPVFWWLALPPGPILVALAIYFRLTERPRPFTGPIIDCDIDGPVIH